MVSTLTLCGLIVQTSTLQLYKRYEKISENKIAKRKISKKNRWNSCSRSVKWKSLGHWRRKTTFGITDTNKYETNEWYYSIISSHAPAL